MVDIASITERLNQLGFSTAVLERYNEVHRFYHNLDHLLDVLNFLEKKSEFSDALFLAAVYHDAIYDPKAKDSEEKSAALFLEESSCANIDQETKLLVQQLILDTKTHTPSSPASSVFLQADLNILDSPFEKLLDYENKIFKEFQFADYTLYRDKRIEVLESLNKNGQLHALIAYVKHRKPSIAVFCGSFNPFHKGHYNVLKKAERIFDKVIIAFGKNPDKQDRTWPVPSVLQYHQLESYSGLLTDFIGTLSHDVIVIRGLRNSTDFQYEQNQYRYIQELMPEIKIINIFCDKEFEHISSSGIRTLEKFNKHQGYLLE